MTKGFARISLGRWVFLLYVVLLISSHVLRRMRPEASPPPHLRSISLPELNNQEASGNTVHITFEDNQKEGPVILLLPGSPAFDESLKSVYQTLNSGSSHRVILPDLPGFGSSSRHLPDYSFGNSAAYLSQFLDSLSIPSAHVVAFSTAGGVVTEWTHLAPKQLNSVTLLSAMGVQEMELLGDYFLNRSLYALQYAFLWFRSEAIPHFGYFDRSAFSLSHGRVFYDSDQRPFRQYWTDYTGPLLIIHGDQDTRVSYSTALEHHRVVAQSELFTFRGAGHDLPSSQSDSLAFLISDLVSRTESSQQIASQRQHESPSDPVPFDASQYPPAAGTTLFVLLGLIALSTLISEDIAAIGAGLLVARGSLEIDQALFATFVGIFGGDITLYVAGRLVGAKLITYPPFSWLISDRKLERGKIWFRNQGAKVVLISRIVPGSRFPTYVAAGILKAPFWKFIGLFLVGTVIWTPLIVGLSTVMGSQILDFWSMYESVALYAILGFVAIIYGTIHWGLPLLSRDGRSRFFARIGRLQSWHFWPRWLIFAPVYAYVGWLMLKFRSIRVFTAANPGSLRDNTSEFIHLDPTNQVIQNPHVEFSVFYHRYPDQDTGHISHLFQKEPMVVWGNGKHTIDRLILEDAHLKKTFPDLVRHFEPVLDNVLPEGTPFDFTTPGKSTSFLRFSCVDELITSQVTAIFNSMSTELRLFFIGRMDVLAKDGTSLASGNDLVPLNVAEATQLSTYPIATNISWLKNVKMLQKQWKIRFEIGAYNHTNGTPLTPYVSLFKRF